MTLRQVYTEIEINSTPERVWNVLMDFSKFHEWNPLFNFIEGQAQVGTPLREHIYLFGKGGPMVKWGSKVIIADPPNEFAWRGHVWFRQFGLGEHHFQIIPVAPNKVRFAHWEIFFGIVPSILGFIMRPKTAKLFDAMNLAMKKRIEEGS